MHTYLKLDVNGTVKSVWQYPQVSSQNKTGHLEFWDKEGHSCASSVLLF
jgi:hypothetical protein